ncbi:MAG: enoyl-CoA hydratase/isomerase family protein, partial [Promethearchaeota archaeon]
MNQYKTIELEIFESEGFAIIYLNRPDQLNALNNQLCDDFYLAIEEVSKKDFIRCLIITGRGKAFCAGGDLVEFQQSDAPGNFLYDLASNFHKSIKILKSINTPSIAAINGPCFGVGLSLACACDLRFCTNNAKFSVAFTSVGLSPDSSLTYHLPKIVGLPLANEMALLNRILTSEEAEKYNLVSQIIGGDTPFLEEIKKIAQKISNGPTLAFGSTKYLFSKSFTNDLNAHLEEEL